MQQLVDLKKSSRHEVKWMPCSGDWYLPNWRQIHMRKVLDKNISSKIFSSWVASHSVPTTFSELHGGKAETFNLCSAKYWELGHRKPGHFFIAVVLQGFNSFLYCLCKRRTKVGMIYFLSELSNTSVIFPCLLLKNYIDQMINAFVALICIIHAASITI